jgi:hypothetical protein
MIDIEKVREGLENKILYTRGMFDSHQLGSYYYDVFDVKPIIESLTELERLQKREVEMKEVIRKYQVENDNLHSWGVASTILDRFLKELESDEK